MSDLTGDALERVCSALDIWAEVPLGVQSDAVLGVVDDRLAEFYAALDEARKEKA